MNNEKLLINGEEKEKRNNGLVQQPG